MRTPPRTESERRLISDLADRLRERYGEDDHESAQAAFEAIIDDPNFAETEWDDVVHKYYDGLRTIDAIEEGWFIEACQQVWQPLPNET